MKLIQRAKVKRLQALVTKAFLVSVLALVLLLPTAYFLPPALAVGATLSLSPAVGSFNTGCSFSVDILLDTGASQTDGTDSIVIYDPSRFTATAVRSGTVYPDYPGNVIDAQTGKVTVSGLASLSSPYSGSGKLATIDFTVLSTAPTGATKIRFDFDPTDKAKTTDSNVVERGTVVDILNQVNDGNYTIGTGACSTANVTPAPGGGFGIGSPTSTPSSVIVVPTKTPVVLPPSADMGSTMALVIAGTVLTVLGILGAAFL